MKLSAFIAAVGLLAGQATQLPPGGRVVPPRTGVAPRPDPPLPKAVVADQPGAPLAVAVPQTRWVGAGSILDVYIVVRSAGGRGVTAYGTRAEFESAAGRREECHRFNVLSPGKVIQAGQSDGKSRFHGFAPGAEPKSVSVALDFAEFDDGSTWGPDACGTAERLAAERAGGRAALAELRRLLKSEGPQAVVDAARHCETTFPPPDEYPAELRGDYGLGARTVCSRVQRSHEQEGLTEIGATLDKPYDASGARP